MLIRRFPGRRLVPCLAFGFVLTTAPAVFAADEPPTGEPAEEASAVAAPVVLAAATPPTVPEVPAAYFERLTVLGAGSLVEVPGSAHVLAAEQLERQDHTDLHRILRQVPGVVVQDEDGYGLRPNIGMRGTGVERSSKITLLEDGVPIAPAPYSAPAAYYSPTAGRMTGFEVVKGASAVRQGPFTTGGVINMLSSDYPLELGGRLEASWGTDATGKLHAVTGDTSDRVSWLLETFQLTSDGFKDLDGGGNTGVELSDYVGKLRLNSSSGARVQQALELKLSRTDQAGDETYLGLTAGDFAATPYRRYAASAQDQIDTEHEQVQVRYFVQPSDRWDVTTTVYRNDFFRNWYKLGHVGGVGIATLLDNPARHAGLLAVVRGEADSAAGALSVRNNRRDYSSQGVETVLGVHLGTRVRHEIEVGVRLHEDEEDRFQEDDFWQMLDGRMVLSSRAAPGSNDNRISSAEAVAFFAQDRIRAGRWMLRPGIRFESIDFRSENFGRNDPQRTGASLVDRSHEVDAWVPGLGVDYLLDDTSSLFVGVHRGFAPPGPGADGQTRPEESLNYELGYRRVGKPFDLEAIAFFSDYDNLLGRDTLSSGGAGTGDLFNGGEVDVYGLELAAGTDLGERLGFAWSLPVRLAYTWTEGEFRNSFTTSFADWGPAVTAGDALPYLPEHQLFASVGATVGRWGVFLDSVYTSAIRTSPGSGAIPAGELVDSAVVFDLAGKVTLPRGLGLELQVRNLADETYVAARRPAGLRPGLPRTLLGGVSWSF